MSEWEDKPELDPKNYRWGGFIYYNRNDSRILVPKRNPVMGATLNFAKPVSYLLLLPIVIIILLVIFLPQKN
ncbi:MAG: DUF5808 domain-containing protein [Bacteroidota bacterium]